MYSHLRSHRQKIHKEAESTLDQKRKLVNLNELFIIDEQLKYLSKTNRWEKKGNKWVRKYPDEKSDEEDEESKE